MADLRSRVAALRGAAGTGPAGDDAAVIDSRLTEAERLLSALEATAEAAVGERREVRHDLVNALGAMDNFAELIFLDTSLPEAEAVRVAVRHAIEDIRRADGVG